MDDGPQGLTLQFIVIIALTGVNAFFASAEMAMVSCNKNKIESLAEEGNSKAKTLLKVIKDQTRFLSTIQVGITLAGFFSSASAATSISQVLGAKLQALGIAYGSSISFIVVTMALSFLTILFGELVPKRIALQNPETIALFSIGPISIFSKISYPFVKLLSTTTTLVLKLLGKYSEDVEEKISEEELKAYLKVSQQQGVINLSGEEMIVNIMDFDDLMCREIMTPRTSLFMIEVDEFSKDSIKDILDSGFSRIPIYEENPDNVVGIIHVKDLFESYVEDENINIRSIMNPPYFVPETKKIDILLKELQRQKTHMAILVDEYGGVSGMVSIEDIIEEIVGDIEDEYDEVEHSIYALEDGKYIVEGQAELDDINEELGLDLESENHETLSGLMIELLGYIPEDGEDVSVVYNEEVVLRAVEIKGRIIENVEIEKID